MSASTVISRPQSHFLSMPLLSGAGESILPNQLEEGYRFHSAGALFGSDYAFSQIGIGGQAGYQQLDAKIQNQAGSFILTQAFGRVYGTVLPFKHSNFYINLAGGYSTSWYDLSRNVAPQTARATPRGYEIDGFMNFGYDFWFNNFRLTPLLGAQYIGTYIKGYREHGGGMNNAIVPHYRNNSLRSNVGLALGGAVQRRSFTWRPDVHGLWQREYWSQSQNLTIASAAFNTQSEFVVLSTDRNYGIIGTEQFFIFKDRWSFSILYDFQWSQHLRDNTLMMNVGFYF